MNQIYIIRKDIDRYEGLGSEFPDEIVVAKGTKNQALRLANYMSNFYPGCDFIFSVEGCDMLEHLSVEESSAH